MSAPALRLALSRDPPSVANLPAKMHYKTPFNHPSWWGLLTKELLLNQILHYHIVDSDDNIIAYLPMRLQTYYHVRLPWLGMNSLSNYYTPYYHSCWPADRTLQADALRCMIEKLRRARNLDELRVWPLEQDDPWLTQGEALLKAQGFSTERYPLTENWYYPVTHKNFDDYLAERPSALRHTLLRKQKALEKRGFQMQMVTHPRELRDAIKAYQKVYAASWKPTEPDAMFIPNLIQWAANHGWLRLGLGWLNGKPVATQLWLVADGTAYIYKLAHDDFYDDYSPGTVLTAFMMQHVLDIDHVKHVDFLHGNEEYKSLWMTEKRTLWGLRAAHPGTWRGKLLQFAMWLNQSPST